MANAVGTFPPVVEHDRGSALRFRREEQRAIAQEWLEDTLAAYPSSTSQFLARERDPFHNPIGRVLREHVPALTAELLGSMEKGRIAAALEPIVRIGAVQDVDASRVVGFVFRLKRILRARWQGRDEDLRIVDARIDDAALLAFDLFVRCREQIYAVKADEARRRVAQLERIYLGVDRR
ncbi:MAG TPA: RsbRD N-terminal domain-containing protein [bacterium]|nr:RsbRD N-terminal domain-containing protein [bacterium]